MTHVLKLFLIFVLGFGCDDAENDPVTGINSGCNFAGICVMSECYCCTTSLDKDSFCSWTCDFDDPDEKCFEFKGTYCTIIAQYSGIYLVLTFDVVNEDFTSDIVCNNRDFPRSGISIDIQKQVT